MFLCVPKRWKTAGINDVHLAVAGYGKMGWVPPMGSHSDALTHTANGQIIICARKEENSAVAGYQTGAGSQNIQTGS